MLESMLIRVPGIGSDGAYMHQVEDFLFMFEGALEVWLMKWNDICLNKAKASGSRSIVVIAGLTRLTNRQRFSG